MRSHPLERCTLSARLIVFSLIALMFCTGIGGALVREQLHGVVLRSVEAGLRDRIEQLQAEFSVRGLTAAHGPRLDQGEFGRIFSGWYWVLRHRGETFQSRSLWDSTLDVAQAQGWPQADGFLTLHDSRQKPLLGLRQHFDMNGEIAELHVFGPLEETLAEWRRIDRILLLTLLGLMLAMMASTLLQVRLGLLPLRRLQQALVAIQEGRQMRLEQSFGPDLDPMADAMNQVLQSNARIVERARHQAADLGHALKKPLSVLAMQARNEQLPVASLQEQVRAMSHTIDRHLARFGSGAGSAERVPLPEALARLLMLMRQIHADKALDWRADMPETLFWRGAVSDLEEMAGNLLDNAGKWAASRVEITVRAEPEHICLRVEDDGAGMTPAQMQQALERGQRFDEKVEGHGLGLAIVQDIAETYEGRLHMRTSALGGLCCELLLPGAFRSEGFSCVQEGEKR